MPHFDLPLGQLRAYRPDLPEPVDFDTFWKTAIDEAREAGGNPALRHTHSALETICSYDVQFQGYRGEPVRAWLHTPRALTPRAVVITFSWYGGGRGLIHENVLWAAAGYAHLVVDARGQGAMFGRGDTADPYGSAPSYPGFVTRGIEDPRDHYYTRAIIDSIRSVDAVGAILQTAGLDVVVAGISQGGGLAIAAAALSEEVVAALIDVPFMCNFPRAISVASDGPYLEVVHYLAARRDLEAKVLATLSYFDGVHFAARATPTALFSVALMDTVCPPSTVFAAYNAYRGAAEIEVYPYNGHEGGGVDHQARQLDWLAAQINARN